MIYIDLPADLNLEDDEGRNIARLADAVAPDAVIPGAVLVAGTSRITGWKRTKLYRHLREHAEAGRAIRVSGGRWRARTPEDRSP